MVTVSGIDWPEVIVVVGAEIVTDETFEALLLQEQSTTSRINDSGNKRTRPSLIRASIRAKIVAGTRTRTIGRRAVSAPEKSSRNNQF
jgi:hypothetical protein